jgi:hypothetical protein
LTIFLQIGFVAAGYLLAATVLRQKIVAPIGLAVAAGVTAYGYRDLTGPQERPGYADAVAVAIALRSGQEALPRVSSTAH